MNTISYWTRRRWAKRHAFNYEDTLGLTDSSSSNGEYNSEFSSGNHPVGLSSSQGETTNQHFVNTNSLAIPEDSERICINNVSNLQLVKQQNCGHKAGHSFIDYNNTYCNDVLLDADIRNYESDSDNREIYDFDATTTLKYLFKNSEKTVDEAICQFFDSHIKNNKSKTCLQDDLKVLKSCLPKPNNMPSSVYKLFDYISVLAPPCEIFSHYCCKICKFYCGMQRPIVCPACNSRQESVRFYELDIINQIKYLFEHRNLGDVLDRASLMRNRDENIISDITDGLEYKRVNLGRGQYDLTLMMSTDGACLRKSSKSNLWPVSFMIAEVPPTIRRLFIICVSIWYADIKPEMNSYLLPICLRLKRSFQNGGLLWAHPRTGSIFRTKVTVPLIVADAPARAMVQNVHNFNGTYGCNICEIKTRQTRQEEGKRRIRVYKYRYEEWQLRTNERMNILGKLAEKSHKIIKGIKGRTIVRLLPGVDISTMVFPEILHSVGLGVAKQMNTLWIEKSGEWNIKAHLDDIDMFLLQIKPSNSFHRIPRRLSLSKFWKGYEYFYWALFYSVPALEKYLPDKYIQHWMLFVISLNILLQDKIRIQPDLEIAEYLIKKFVEQFEQLYGERELSYNIHQMIHLGLSTRRWGPLSGSSAFQFEDFIGTLSRMVHGSKHIDKELVNKIKISQGIQILKNRVELQKSPSQRIAVDDCLGKCRTVIFSEEEIYLLETMGLSVEDVKVYLRARINGEIFTSKLYKAIKTVSYIVKCKTSENSVLYGSIRFFIIHHETLFFIIEPCLVHHAKILYHRESRSKISHIIPIKDEHLPALIFRIKDIHNLNKMLQIKNYVCIIPTSMKKNVV